MIDKKIKGLIKETDGGLGRVFVSCGAAIWIPVALFVLLVLFQMVPLPAGVLKVVSPATYELYEEMLPEVGGQKSDVRGRRSEVGKRQRSEVGGQKSEVRRQRSEVRSQTSEVGGREKTEIGGQRTQKSSKLKAESSKERGDGREGRKEIEGRGDPL